MWWRIAFVVFKELNKAESPFSNLEVLELRGMDFDAKKINRISGRVIGHQIRTRYMVTRCYQLVQHLPKLKIIVSGYTSNFVTKLDPNTLRLEYEHRVRDTGLGCSKEEEKEFLKLKNAQRGPHLSIPNPKTNDLIHYRDNHSMKDHHWKILFKNEWQKIWDLGLQCSAEGSGTKEFYDAVFDTESTKDTYEFEDDNFQSDDDGSSYDSIENSDLW